MKAIGFGVMSIMSGRVYGAPPRAAPPGPFRDRSGSLPILPAHDPYLYIALGDRSMNAEFNWWLLIVGLVLGASLTWLVMSESVRRDIDVSESEARVESRWIATVLSGAGKAIDPQRVEEVLRLHREYLAAPPPDEPISPSAAPLAPLPNPVTPPPDPLTPPSDVRLERDA